MYEVIESSAGIMGVIGSNATIRRGSKTLPLAATKTQTLIEASGKMPPLGDGDRLVTGDRSIITIHSGAKDKMGSHGTILSVFPNSEAKISVEEWDKTDKKSNKRFSGKAVTKVELMRGTFNISTSEPLATPTAEFKSEKQTSLLVDITADGTTVFKPSDQPTEVLCKGTGKKKEFKATTPQEVIITRQGFYHKGFLDLDKRFSELQSLAILGFSAAGPLGGFKDDDKLMNDMASNFKTFDATDIVKNLQSFKSMDVTKFPGLTPEQMKQMQDAQKQMAALEKAQGISIADMMLKGQKEIEKARKSPEMMKSLEQFQPKAKASSEKFSADMEGILDKFEKLPPYPPLHEGFKIA